MTDGRCYACVKEAKSLFITKMFHDVKSRRNAYVRAGKAPRGADGRLLPTKSSPKP